MPPVAFLSEATGIVPSSWLLFLAVVTAASALSLLFHFTLVRSFRRTDLDQFFLIPYLLPAEAPMLILLLRKRAQRELGKG